MKLAFCSYVRIDLLVLAVAIAVHRDMTNKFVPIDIIPICFRFHGSPVPSLTYTYPNIHLLYLFKLLKGLNIFLVP